MGNVPKEKRKLQKKRKILSLIIMLTLGILNRSPPWTQKKTLHSIVLDDCTNEKKICPKN